MPEQLTDLAAWLQSGLQRRAWMQALNASANFFRNATANIPHNFDDRLNTGCTIQTIFYNNFSTQYIIKPSKVVY